MTRAFSFHPYWESVMYTQVVELVQCVGGIAFLAAVCFALGCYMSAR